MISKIYNRDCLEFMKQSKDNEYDLAIVDVPYGIKHSTIAGKQSGTQYGNAAAPKANYAIKDWDDYAPDEEYFKELLRVSKNQIIWGANHFISKIPFDSSCWIVWDKDNGSNGFADCELAWASFKSAVRKYKFTWNGMIQGNMADKEQRIHPTQKPVRLYEWLLANYAKEGDKILDTHGGSMSSVIACLNLDFQIDCLELDKDYYEQAKFRINEHQKQSNLFTVKQEVQFYD